MNAFVLEPETGSRVLRVFFQVCRAGLRQVNEFFVVTEIRIAKFRMCIQFQRPQA